MKDETQNAIDALAAFGMAPSVARMLTRRHGADTVLRQTRWRPGVGAAGIREAIEKDLPQPRGRSRDKRRAAACANWDAFSPSVRFGMLRQAARQVPIVVRRLGRGRRSVIVRGATLGILEEELYKLVRNV